MKTALLRIDEPGAPGSSYPVRLFVEDGPAWETTPVAESVVSPDLADPDPPTDEAGQPLAADAIVPYLLEQHDPSPAFLSIGRYLFRQLAPGELGQRWQALEAEHGAPGGEGLRTIVDIRPGRLRRLPWELVAIGERRLCLNPGNPWYRRSAAARPVPPGDLGPLRVLIVLGSREADVMGEEEVAEILRALRQVGVAHVLRAPDRELLERTYSGWRPHVVHFIAHGMDLPGSGPVLLLGDGDKEWQFRRQEVVHWAPGWTGRLAILNACRTDGAPSPELHEATWSLAEAFAERGFAAVVGMQGDIDVKAAAAFSKPLYAAIGQGEPLDVAIARARYAMSVQTDLDRREWALPSVSMSTAPEAVLAVQRPAPAIDLEATPEFARIREFIDRGPERIGLWLRLDPEGFGVEPSGLSLVVGDRLLGKTWLIWQVLWICAVRARTVRYVNLESHDQNHLHWLDVLRRIRDGSGAVGLGRSPLQGPLPRRAFDEFNHVVNHVAAGRQPPPYEAALGPVEDERLEYQPGVEDGVERIFDAFGAALESVAGSGPLVIALDNVSGVQSGYFHLVCDHLLWRARLKRLTDVRLIVALASHELGTHWPPELDTKELQVRVGGIDIVDFLPLAREYFLHNDLAPDDFRVAVEAIQRTLREPWRPQQLRDLLRALGAGT